MRLPEKTIEVNFCTQLERRLRRPLFWFGLTQRQEARAGFDVATAIRGTLFLFQLKASAFVLKDGSRRFDAQHHQLQALQRAAHGRDRGIFYVLPSLGTTADISKTTDVIGRSWFLDVASLPPAFPAPTINGTRTPRKNGRHYMYLQPPTVTIRSDPISAPVMTVDSLAEILIAEPVARRERSLAYTDEEFEAVRRLFTGSAVGAVLGSA